MLLHTARPLRLARITGTVPSKVSKLTPTGKQGPVAILETRPAQQKGPRPYQVHRGAANQDQPPLRLQKQAIVVEGLADKRAVQRAVPDSVFVLGSSKWVEGRNSERVLESLGHGLPQFERVVVLMDPDVSGRQGRNILEAAFPGQLWHAFLPAHLATSAKATRWHDVGNVGIEHASPASIRESLSSCRRATPGRKHFTREQLMELGLVSTFTDYTVQTKGRREALCNLLGIGICDGKQLLKQLNVYNFTDDDFQRALSMLKGQQ